MKLIPNTSHYYMDSDGRIYNKENADNVKTVAITSQGQFNVKLPSGVRIMLNHIKTFEALYSDSLSGDQQQTINHVPANKGIKRLFFDLETSPNVGIFWRAGWKLNITPQQIIEERRVITCSYKWEGEDTVYHLNWDQNKCDKRLLGQFTEILKQADEVIAHNGDRFDIKWLRTRCLFHGINFPTHVKTLDTLKKVKQAFNLQSNTLAYVAEYLGLESKGNPGGLQAWITLVFSDIDTEEYKSALRAMHEYCDLDVVLLEKVYAKIMAYIKPNTHAGVIAGGEKYACPSCGHEHPELIKEVVTPAGTKKYHLDCPKCKGDYVVSATNFKKLNEAT